MSESSPPSTPSGGYAEILKQLSDVSERVKGIEERLEGMANTTEEREGRKISEALRPLQDRVKELETSISNIRWFVGIAVAVASVLVTILSRIGVV